MQRIIKGEKYEKRIEQKTVRKKGDVALDKNQIAQRIAQELKNNMCKFRHWDSNISC